VLRAAGSTTCCSRCRLDHVLLALPDHDARARAPGPSLLDVPTADRALLDGFVSLPHGRPRLAVRQAAGPQRPFVLVHGLASNARLWDGVADHLIDAGHQVIAVDLRGHGRSEAPADGYDTDTCADDVAALIETEKLVDDRVPIVAGQSWGGNVVLSLAARHSGAVAALCCVDGGWISLQDRFAGFEDCWAVLAPPRFDDLTYADLAAAIRMSRPDWPPAGIEGTLANLVELPGGGVRARLSREHHADIVRSLYEGDPAQLYPLVGVPALLVPAVGSAPAPGEGERAEQTRAAVVQALAALPDGRVSWYPGADHDLHAQHPARLAADLLALAADLPAADLPAADRPEGEISP
jgi:pimeloyl-ACP methyl ester carboxylesterase